MPGFLTAPQGFRQCHARPCSSGAAGAIEVGVRMRADLMPTRTQFGQRRGIEHLAHDQGYAWFISVVQA